MTTPDNALIDADRGRDPQPQALRVAAWLINAPHSTTHGDMLIGGRELRRLHAESAEQADRIASLEAEKLASKDDIELLQAKAKAMQVACATQVTSLEVELKKKSDTLTFVERWAVHHGTKPHITAEQALGFIQHHPRIKAITASYVDGKHPETFDPYAEIEQLKAQLVTQTNRAAEAEQQVTALTQRLDTANALNTEARNQLAQLSQAQVVPTERLHNACAYALEWLNECGGNLAHNVVDVLEQALAASPTPPVRKGLSDEQIEAAAQKLAICMDYPWEFMPDKGKKRMRFDALCIIEAAHGIQGEGNAR